MSGEARDFATWRALARERLAAATPPDEAVWSDWKNPSLFAGRHSSVAAAPRTSDSAGSGTREGSPPVSRELLTLLETLACYRDASRWDLMYRLIWRVANENRSLLQNDADLDVRTARLWSKAVSQDVHKMHAFVRFHETSATDDGNPTYVAWFEPAHEILRYAAPFFEKRFGNMRWMIATPDGAALWNGAQTTFIDSPGRSCLPRQDATHDLWRTYYRNICNVARVNPRTMQREMPQRYWRHLPEAPEIKTILQNHPRVLHETLRSAAATDPNASRIPQAIAKTLEQNQPASDSPTTCRRCNLWQRATQAVPGEGPKNARIMLVGEQPGDEEDIRGRPFVGPAGQVLDDALLKAGLAREGLFITNAVKHFKWEPRGKRRLHVKPQQHEIHACGSWLHREISEVSPRLVVALGVTAVRAVTGLSLTMEEARRLPLHSVSGLPVVATYHPSAILRAPDERKTILLADLIKDLTAAAAGVP